ncbi:hypothetical protein D3C73_1084260 [compost metagenome]
MLPAILLAGPQHFVGFRQVARVNAAFVNKGICFLVDDVSGFTALHIYFNYPKALVTAINFFVSVIPAVVVAPVQFGRTEKIDRIGIYFHSCFSCYIKNVGLIRSKIIAGLGILSRF